jgi:methyl-accepting chemotaxis protein
MDHCQQAMTHLAEESQRIGSDPRRDQVGVRADQPAGAQRGHRSRAGRRGGRGFAVVADEVRGLAQRTQQSTEEIEQLIGSLHSGTEQVMGLLDDSKRLTDRASS